jgi:hypothetical protein
MVPSPHQQTLTEKLNSDEWSPRQTCKWSKDRWAM